MNKKIKTLAGVMALAMPMLAFASSHREAPSITETPKVDATDFYMFNSYEAGRTGFVTMIANYIPSQDPYAAGPNFATMDDNALYEIHIDNNGDNVEDVTFQFQFTNTTTPINLTIGGQSVAIPLIQAGGVGPTAADTANLSVAETYTINMITGDRRTGTSAAVTNIIGGATTFVKPVDNIGTKTIANYPAYAATHIYDVAIPGCGTGKVFVGQRKESFSVNLGEIFDLINTNPLGPVNAEVNTVGNNNISTIAMEVPVACLTAGTETVVGGWTTASKRQAQLINPTPAANGKPATIHGGAWTQVSRLGSPLVNEVVIGLPDKDKFNHSEPKDDAQFAVYVTNPTLPALIEILYPSAPAPTLFPRADLVQAFLTGVPNLNQPANPAVGSEMLRLDTASLPVAAAAQNTLGVIAGDNAGFPNGRRPGDDVVDIALRVVMGVLLPVADAPAGQAPLTDGAFIDASFFDVAFPYLKAPIAGSPSN